MENSETRINITNYLSKNPIRVIAAVLFVLGVYFTIIFFSKEKGEKNTADISTLITDITVLKAQRDLSAQAHEDEITTLKLVHESNINTLRAIIEVNEKTFNHRLQVKIEIINQHSESIVLNRIKIAVLEERMKHIK